MENIENIHLMINKITDCTTEKHMFEVMDELFTSIGVKFYNYTPIIDDTHCITHHNYNQSWVQRYIKNEYARIDPAVVTGKATNSIKSWGESCTFAEKFIKLNTTDKSLVKDMKKSVAIEKLENGIVMPVVSHCYKQHGFYLAFRSTVDIDSQKFRLHISTVCLILHNQFFDIITYSKKSKNKKYFKVEEPKPITLSPRERYIVKLLCNGKNREDCAAFTGMALSTINTLLKRAYIRAKVNSQTQLVVISFLRGWWRNL